MSISMSMSIWVFLSRNYGLIVAPRKFDVVKTNICPRREAARANMLVLRTSNFQGATTRPIVPSRSISPTLGDMLLFRDITFYCLCSPLLSLFTARQFKNQIELVSTFLNESRESQTKNLKRKINKTQFHLFMFFKSSLVYRNYSRTSTCYPGIFLERALWADSVSPRMNAIASRDQFKPIRIGENLVANYNLW